MPAGSRRWGNLDNWPRRALLMGLLLTRDGWLAIGLSSNEFAWLGHLGMRDPHGRKCHAVPPPCLANGKGTRAGIKGGSMRTLLSEWKLNMSGVRSILTSSRAAGGTRTRIGAWQFLRQEAPRSSGVLDRSAIQFLSQPHAATPPPLPGTAGFFRWPSLPGGPPGPPARGQPSGRSASLLFRARPSPPHVAATARSPRSWASD